MITLYGIANCDSIKKTKLWLSTQGLDFQFHDYKKAGCSPELAKTLLQQFDWQDVINKRGTTWRKLSDSQKTSVTQASAVDLMCTQTSIIKRPIIESSAGWILGYSEEKMQQLLD